MLYFFPFLFLNAHSHRHTFIVYLYSVHILYVPCHLRHSIENQSRNYFLHHNVSVDVCISCWKVIMDEQKVKLKIVMKTRNIDDAYIWVSTKASLVFRRDVVPWHDSSFCASFFFYSHIFSVEINYFAFLFHAIFFAIEIFFFFFLFLMSCRFRSLFQAVMTSFVILWCEVSLHRFFPSLEHHYNLPIQNWHINNRFFSWIFFYIRVKHIVFR